MVKPELFSLSSFLFLKFISLVSFTKDMEINKVQAFVGPKTI